LECKGRDEIEAKMAAVFGDQMRNLSTELQQILIDDMVKQSTNWTRILMKNTQITMEHAYINAIYKMHKNTKESDN
jgi:hypothetical protein